MKKSLLALMTVVALSGCAGLSDTQMRVGSGAAIGAGVGHVVGGGDGAAIVGGAVLGGLVGNAVDQNAKDRERDARYERERRYNECLRYNSRRYCDRQGF